MISRAKRRIVSTLSDALSRNSELEVTIQVDALRSTRPSKTQTSPAHLLLPLIDAYPDRVQVRLFRSPKLSGPMRFLVPRRFDEGWGTWHAKVYLVDDEVLLSGSPDIADYLVRLLRVFAGYSSTLRATSESSLGYALDWPRHDSSRYSFANLAKEEINNFQTGVRCTRPQDDTGNQVVVFPMVQSGVLGIHEEERCLHALFDLLDSEELLETPLVEITSGYFALYGPYQDRAVASKADYRVVAASPSANGFLGSKGLSGRIPEGYTLLERRFWDRVLAAHRQWDEDKGIELREWSRTGWTYHAKGIWLMPSFNELPCATLFGSTNLNSRSAHLDTEISFLLSVPEHNNSLRTALKNEILNIKKNTSKVDEHTFASPERRQCMIVCNDSVTGGSSSATRATRPSPRDCLGVKPHSGGLYRPHPRYLAPPPLIPLSPSSFVNYPSAAAMRDTSNATNLFGVPPRSPGTQGRQVQVRTNMFGISYPRGGQWHHYDADGVLVDLPPPRNREIIDRLQAREAAIFRPRGVYDGRKNLFSINQFSFHPAGEVGVDTSGRPNTRRPGRRRVVKLKFAGLINMSALDPLMGGRVGIDQADATQIAVTALNYVIRMAPVTNSDYPLKGSSFFMDIPGVSKDLKRGFKLYRGFFQSVRPAIGRMLVNIDVATGVVYVGLSFRPISVLDFVMEFLKLRDPRELGQLQEAQLISLTRVLKGVKVIATVPRRTDKTKSIKSFHRDGPDSYMFDKDGQQVSVSQHMRDAHGARVQYPRAPCVIINRDAAFPMEFLEIAPHQILKRPVPPDLTPDVLNFSTQRPDQRIRQITQGFQSDYLRGAGVQVDREPVTVQARVLNPPQIEFGDRQTLNVSNGTWNMVRKTMFKPAKVGCWAIALFAQQGGNALGSRLAKRLAQVMKETVLVVLDDEPVVSQFPVHDIPSLGKDALQRTWSLKGHPMLKGEDPRNLFKMPDLIVCVIPFPAPEIRAAIKRWGDCEMGVATQCVVGSKYAGQRNDDQYLNNLVLK
ncbi:CDP-diacylglycerol-glycerol-3-phosphate 3-phosphatidyltransferase [Rhizoctonia solani AG-1 IA]|uniref:CDP-diacylglycerol--glycerol-3-phosphate 1-phosphatidyltransferase n=1 Tax=Thanatephorus cucumeris (strain AG1-IA) TaxID=983506 RepID=L8X6L7_THACA|nr:CDP-diacylglycerol-glycerol-3-phosphate 3-phosphatidyltransferase [Rhizoctonia solani AG-1 IA]